MSAPAAIDVELLGEAKRRQLFGSTEEELREHPTAFYRAGFAAVCATGLVKPTQDYVLLRAITDLEVSRSATSSIILHSGDRLRNVQCFEIVDVGPVVREVQKRRWFRRAVSIMARQDSGVGMVRIHYPYGALDHLRVGHHVQSVATAADAVDPAGDGLHQLIRACFLPAAWDPTKMADKVVNVVKEAFEGDQERKRLKAEENARIQAEIEADRQAFVAEREAERARRLEAWERGEANHPDQAEEVEEEEDDVVHAPYVHIPPQHQSAG